MKMFISWSGERSQALAQTLRDWIPLVLHYVEPWLSKADVAAGERWEQAVTKELEASNFGVICVTPENVTTPWILFEAGALAKSMQGSRVIPLLLDLDFSDISGPLAQFQAKKVERVGLIEVIQSINQTSDEKVPEARVKQLFEALWPELEKKVASIAKNAPTEKHMRPQHEIFEELVAAVRAVDSRLRDIETVVSDEGARPVSRRRGMRFHPFIVHELPRMAADGPRDPTSILVLASFFREHLPWAYELGMEAYRAAKAGPSSEARRALERFKRGTEFMMHGPFPVEELGFDPEAMMIIRHELERLLMPERSDEEQRAKPKSKARKSSKKTEASCAPIP